MVSVFIPIYNESDILPSAVTTVAHYLRELGQPFELLLVDNGSSDASLSVAESLKSAIPELTVLSLPTRGPGRAFTLALEKAGGESIVTLDVDLSSGCGFIGDSLRLLAEADMVIGSKSLGKQKRRFLRVLVSQTYLLFTNWYLFQGFSDYSIGYKAFRRSAILPYASRLDPWTGYILELVIALSLRGLKIVQLGIECEDLRPSHFSLAYEGWYRFRHLFRTFRLLRNPESWFHTEV